MVSRRARTASTSASPPRVSSRSSRGGNGIRRRARGWGSDVGRCVSGARARVLHRAVMRVRPTTWGTSRIARPGVGRSRRPGARRIARSQRRRRDPQPRHAPRSRPGHGPSFRHPTALVTGGTTGLGLAMARALRECGRKRGDHEPRQRHAPNHAAADMGPNALGLAPLDVRDDGAYAAGVAGVAEVWERLGGIDLLVNNAGIGMRTVNPRFLSDPRPFWAVSPPGFRDVLDTKVTGCFLMAHAVVPRMLEQGRGRIVMISMSESTMVRRGFVPYGPAGATVEALAG